MSAALWNLCIPVDSSGLCIHPIVNCLAMFIIVMLTCMHAYAHTHAHAQQFQHRNKIR